MGPPTQMPLRFEAAILSRTRSPMTSRSNCANDNRTLRVSRPMLVVVLKDWVIETNETECWSKSSTSLAKSASERGAGQAPIVIPGPDQPPALVCLTLYVCLAGLPLGVERVELQVEIMFGGFAGVDRAAGGFSGSGLHHWPASV